MDDSLYRENILEHYKRPHNFAPPAAVNAHVWPPWLSLPLATTAAIDPVRPATSVGVQRSVVEPSPRTGALNCVGCHDHGIA